MNCPKVTHFILAHAEKDKRMMRCAINLFAENYR